MPERSKASQVTQDSVPWVAVVVAVLGWYDARGTSQDATRTAVKKAEVAKVESQVWSESRLRTAYEAMQEVTENNRKVIARHTQQIEDLEGWVVELESWVEAHIDEDSPRSSREREARSERLSEIRERMGIRAGERAIANWILPAPPTAEAMPDYADVQSMAPPARKPAK